VTPLRILWVKLGGLWPLDRGARLRSFHIVAELSRAHRVSVATTHWPGDDPLALRTQLPSCAEILSFPHAPGKAGSARFITALARSWLSPLPVDLSKWRVPALRRGVARMLASGRFDVCVADFLVAIPNLTRPWPVPVLFFEHNVEHLIWKRLSAAASSWWRRGLLEVEWRKMRRYEAAALARARLTVAVSEPDRAALAALAPTASVHTIPTGVDTSYFAPNGFHDGPPRLVFTGSMEWYPNEDGVLHFIDAILPAIRRDVPDVGLTVVGRNPSARLRAVAQEAGVTVTGTVDDVRPFMAGATVYVVPLRIGGGTRLKIFEALAMGKPVVSTTIGAEGLPLVPGTHFVRADAAADFAAAVVALLRDAGRRRALGEAGRRLVVERYSWAQVARQFEMLCRQAAAR
jgi:glycosyltransferase involved in cell wall biosynthesis